MLGRWKAGRLQAEGGLREVVSSRLWVAPPAGFQRVPGEILELLEEAVKRDPKECVLPSKYNTFCLVEWSLKELSVLLPKMLPQRLEAASEMSIVGEVMGWMQIWLLEGVLGVLRPPKTAPLLENGEELPEMGALPVHINQRQRDRSLFSQRQKFLAERATEIFRGRSREVKNRFTGEVRAEDIERSRLISIRFRGTAQNTIKSMNALLQSHESNEIASLSTDLNVIFLNILLNLRRLIRESVKNSSLCVFLEPLKQLEVKLYYLSAITLPSPAAFSRSIANEPSHSLRGRTYLHLLHEPAGLQRLNYYLQEASLGHLQQDMVLLSSLLNA